MDIWRWVARQVAPLRAAGHNRLAVALVQAPELAARGQTQRIEGLLAPASESAETAVLPWAGAYLRFWALRSRVGNRQHGAIALADINTMHTEVRTGEGPMCPEIVCPAELVLLALSNMDGPGHVVERSAQVSQQIDQLSPDWPSFAALSQGYAEILIDDDRPEEAITYLDRQAGRVRAAGEQTGPYYGLAYVRALRQLDRHDDALRALDHLEETTLGALPARMPGRDDVQRRVRFERARLLAWQARTGSVPVETAMEALPGVSEAEAHPDLRAAWAEAVENLVELGRVRNNWQLGAVLTGWSRYCERVGAHRRALEMSLIAARLAARRGARWVGGAARARAERALRRVRRADDLAADLAEARADAAALAPVELPVPPEQLLAHLNERPGAAPAADDPAAAAADVETRADLVVAALAVREDDLSLLAALGQLGGALRQPDAAAEAQWPRVAADPSDERAGLVLLDSLHRAEDAAGMARLARATETANPKIRHWALARAALLAGDLGACARECARLVELDPAGLGARRLGADVAARLADWPTAQRLRSEVLMLSPEPRPADRWALVVAATAARDWTTVRALAGQLGLEVPPGTGPIDQRGHAVRIRFTDEDGSPRQAYGRRTGPATARIVQVLPNGAACNVNDVVVFDPTPLEPPPPDEEARRRYAPLYRHVTTLETGGYWTYSYKGVWPGKDIWTQARARLAKAGYPTWDTATGESTGPRARTAVSPDGERLPVLAGRVAVPTDGDPAALDRLLHELTDPWPHPLTWLDLAREIGADLTAHEQAVLGYGL
ncbi:hypothetical protein [Allonocardiopsis opalescens]|uniref:Uncharacterized protein n=1 Tax=Allonocardiopsis opalescens TaxID=1144618 RepID=A0A2T0Q0T5_9ACTN|nr:hypothetical protein [Allonocardiopsis opalescens]PRX97407.1 hypothetical protein CLV72_106446 [Allonocardiopsis opalescens]